MATKLDLGRAWNEAMALLSANRDVILIIAAVFFFLPNVIATLLLPAQDVLTAQLEALGDQPDPEEMMGVFADFFGQSWWIYLVFGLVQAAGVMGLLALLTDSSRPTVGEALGFGLKALVPYLAAQILFGILMVAVPILLTGIGALISIALASLMAFIGLIIAIYIWIKFSLISPVIAIEKVMNPVTALARSWKLTKGNSMRLFAFFVLLVICAGVLWLVVSLVLTLFGVFGEEIGLFAMAIGSGLMSMAFTTVMLVVLAAVHRQLSGAGGEPVGKTFE